MSLKKHMIFLICGFLISFLGSPSAMASDDMDRPLWMRYPAVSPDGATIAFAYGGQIWRVPSSGGEAIPLTSGEFFSTRPVWSPDSRKLAFASKRNGNLDVFIMPARGGAIVRLTDHSSDDLPYAFSPDGAFVYFSSSRLGTPNTVLVGTYTMSDQLYTVHVSGGRTQLLLSTPALDVDVSPDGKQLLYDDRPIYENEWRKGAISDGTRDIWLYDQATATHRKVTSWRGEDRDACWTPDGKGFYYLSEQSGSFNVWHQSLLNNAEPEQITVHKGQPVRFLSVAKDGSVVYGFEGEIRRKAAGSKESNRVPIHISQGSLIQGTFSSNANAYGSEIAVSPNGSEIAVIARGEVFVISLVTGNTRRITDTPQFEQSVSFANGGRTLLYSSERDADSDIFECNVPADRPPMFTAPGPIVEKKIIDTEGDALFPAYSPDGKKIAFLDNRQNIRVFDKETGKSISLLPDGAIYSYQDGDITFAWSPDGRWLTATSGSIVAGTDVVLLDAAGKLKPMDISQSGYVDMEPRFTADSKAIVWGSDRNGLRQADANAGQLDYYIAHLTQEGFDAFQIEASGMAPASPAMNKTETEKDGVPPAISWQPQMEGIQHRTTRLTPFSILPVFSHITADNQNLIFVSLEESGRAVGYRLNLRNHSLSQLFVKPITSVKFAIDPQEANLYALSPAGIERISLSNGGVGMIPLKAEIAYDPRGEIEYLFNHFWRLTNLKFYQPGMHGQDWKALHTTYARFLPHIHAWEDFADLMGEMAGQLNASHMGCFYSATPQFADQTASLGVYEDPSFEGPGIRVTGVLVGGPCDRADHLVKEGTIILAVDGRPIEAAMNIDSLLNQKEGVPVQLSVTTGNPAKAETLVVTPISMAKARTLAYAAWVDKRKQITDTLSKGRIGYLHIPSMDASSYQKAFGELFGELRDKQAVVIDIRFNRGGNLHDQLITLFTGNVSAGFTSRDDRLVGPIPVKRWAKPSALIANAGSYSDGSIFPHLYQNDHIGPVIGARVPGTGTSVWWMTVLNDHIKYGIPQLGAKDFKTGWFENQETVPDLLVYNEPDAIEDGRDPQLEAAVAELLKQDKK
jgi:tricorn protease